MSAAEVPDAREDAARIDRLLEDLQGMAGPSTWLAIEELMERLLRLHGAGLTRTLAHARAAGADGPRLDERVAGDDLLSSLLLLHGLHPHPLRARVERALEQVRPALGSHAGDVELAALDESGVATLRFLGSCSGCPSSRATVEHTVRRAIEEAAPEIVAIRIVGEDAPASKVVLQQVER
ncbi:MAG TPA: NifU family protein [Vulgatibacter sp.]|nr:NifU family protein [Vulgatibacter sp.]